LFRDRDFEYLLFRHDKAMACVSRFARRVAHARKLPRDFQYLSDNYKEAREVPLRCHSDGTNPRSLCAQLLELIVIRGNLELQASTALISLR